jgi:glycosyltransferase involved in cell wall biosynthesis
VNEPPLRVGVNLLFLVPGVVGGTEPYATRLLHALADAAPPELDVVLFALRPFADAHPDLAARFPVVTAPVDGRNRPLRVLVENTWLAREARRRKLDVMHHVGGRVPYVSPVPAVVTIHDLQPLDHPENFTRVKRAFLGRALPRSAQRAAVVIAPSDFVRRGIVRSLGVDDTRAAVVHTPAPLVDLARASLPRPATAGDGPYFVYPAITYAHKNHATLLTAFAALVAERPDVRLVLTGGQGPCEDAVRAQIDRLGIGHAVVRTGRLPHDELDALVEHATALVFPSRYEGFGLPVVEAMASGCPVIAADATALPEIVGDAGRLIDPDDAAGWCNAMAEQLAADRRADGAAGRRRVAAFDAATSVDEMLRAYRRAALGARVG